MSLNEKMTALADAVRSKANRSDTLTIDAMTEAVNGLAAGNLTTETLTVTPTKEQQAFSSSDLGENTYYSTVTVNAIPAKYIDTSDATAYSHDIRSGKTAYASGVKVKGAMIENGSVEAKINNATDNWVSAHGYYDAIVVSVTPKTLKITPSRDRQIFNVITDEKSDVYYSEVTVNAIPDEYITTTDATATSDKIIEGETAYVKGEKVTGRYIPVNKDDVRAGVRYGYFQTGTFTSDATANAWDILEGETAYVNGTKVTGAVPFKQSETYTPGTSDITIPAGIYLNGNLTIKGDPNLEAQNIAEGVTLFGVTGSFTGGSDTSDATVTAADLLEGVTAYGAEGKVTGEIQTVSPSVTDNIVKIPKGYIPEEKQLTVGTSKSAETCTPGTSDITIPADTYLAGALTIKGDASLTAENIKSGVSIFNVSGSFTSDATAAAEDIAPGKTAYVNGVKVTGTASMGEGFYKCVSVEGPQIIYFVSVTGAGISDCNGNYSDSGILKNGQPVYSYASTSGTTWYIYYTTSEWEGDSWVLSDNMNVEYSYGAHYYGSQLSGTWWGGEGAGEEAGQAEVSLECNAVNAGQDRTWSGYKLISAGNGYVLAEELSTGLVYGVGASSDYVNNCITPEVGGIYNSNCTAEICDTQFATDNALTFTAEEAFSSVQLVSDNDWQVDFSGVRYSTDGKVWNAYNNRDTITLSKEGDFVKFINTKNTFSSDTSQYTPGVRFSLSGKVAASGELKSLLNYSDIWPRNCFNGIFRNQNALTVAPYVSCDTLGIDSLTYAFNGCKNLKKIKVSINSHPINPDNNEYDGVDGLLGGCSSLSVIEVDFTSWDGFDTYNGWVVGVAPKGVFIKPAVLPEEYGEKRIPAGWQVVNK